MILTWLLLHTVTMAIKIFLLVCSDHHLAWVVQTLLRWTSSTGMGSLKRMWFGIEPFAIWFAGKVLTCKGYFKICSYLLSTWNFKWPLQCYYLFHKYNNLLQKAIQLNPFDWEAWHSLGEWYVRLSPMQVCIRLLLNWYTYVLCCLIPSGL